MAKTKTTIKARELVEIVNSQALTIRAMMELLNLTDEQIQKKGIEIISRIKAMPLDPDDFYDDEDEYEEDDDFYEDEDELDDDDSEDYGDEEEAEYDFAAEANRLSKELKLKLNNSGTASHPVGAFIFGN